MEKHNLFLAQFNSWAVNSLLILFALSGFSVYGIIIAGWSSNSKYAFLGSLRSAAQMISYEVAISLSSLPVVAAATTLEFSGMVLTQARAVWFVAPLLCCAVIFTVAMLAETNRTPFDLPEAEAELVAGYNIEYSSIVFAQFFLGEYNSMIVISLVAVILFFAGWVTPWLGGHASVMVTKGLGFCLLFVLVRATLPRYRYDTLMEIGWKVLLPVATALLLVAIALIVVVCPYASVTICALPDSLDRGVEIARRLNDAALTSVGDRSLAQVSVPLPLAFLVYVSLPYYLSEPLFREFFTRPLRFISPESFSKFLAWRQAVVTAADSADARASHLNFSHWVPPYRLHKSLQFRDTDGTPLTWPVWEFWARQLIFFERKSSKNR